jgi:hypothetical protein
MLQPMHTDTDVNNILVFKTNIQTEVDKQRVGPILDAHHCITQWNIDQQDIDCVLRVITNTLTAQQVISVIQQHGFDCAELE